MSIAAPWPKWALTFLLFTTALASYYLERFGVYLDPSMLRNVLKSNPAEAGELLNLTLLLHLMVYALIPSIAVFYWPLKPFTSWRQSIIKRGVTIAFLCIVAASSSWAIYQPLASLMRNQKEVRYLLTPANYLYSLAVVAKGEHSESLEARTAIGLDAKLADHNPKPGLLVIVVGGNRSRRQLGIKQPGVKRRSEYSDYSVHRQKIKSRHYTRLSVSYGAVADRCNDKRL